MCGLFGTVLPRHYPAAVLIPLAVDILGEAAQERGRDAAGVAVRDHAGRWTITKTVGNYTRLRRVYPRLRQAYGAASTVLGHTRWATQGGLGHAQASPITIGPLLGTHNGDIDPASIPGPVRLPFDPATTDSHHLFAAIADAHRARRGLTDRLVTLLSTVRGRAALVWTDTSRSDQQIWLARAGLSPLTIATDEHGGLWWASNPAWLREMGRRHRPRHQPTLLPEGSVWTAIPHQRHVTGTLVTEFKPTIRCRDLATARTAVWRGFDHDDETADQILLRHRTVA